MQGRVVHGATLRDLRERAGLRRTELAREAQVSLAWLKYVELEGRQPSGRIVYKLARALSVDIDEFTSVVETAIPA